MHAGSIGHLGSAATVAASSFEMKLTDPHDLLREINWERWISFRGMSALTANKGAASHLTYVEPSGSPAQSQERPESTVFSGYTQVSPLPRTLGGKVQLLGDFIDTDAVCSNNHFGLHLADSITASTG
jgi:hypothetical protein